jgi:hypothetical protein
MAHYLVRAKPKPDRLPRLRELLAQGAFLHLRPFGRALTHSLADARIGEDGLAVWEEEEYCSPSLAQERAAVLDEYFDAIEAERVEPGEGWTRIAGLPRLLKP